MITEGYLARHHMGRAGMMGPALLDVAQDYALQYLFAHDVFELGVASREGLRCASFGPAMPGGSRPTSTSPPPTSTPANWCSTRSTEPRSRASRSM